MQVDNVGLFFTNMLVILLHYIFKDCFLTLHRRQECCPSLLQETPKIIQQYYENTFVTSLLHMNPLDIICSYGNDTL